MFLALLLAHNASATDIVDNPFDDCADFHCLATPTRLASAPVLFVGTVADINQDAGLGALATRTWRLTVSETLRGEVETGLLDVTGPGIDGQCGVGDQVLVAAHPIPVVPCPPEPGSCSGPVIAELAALDFSGSMVCKHADGSLGSPGARFGPVCFNGQDFRHPHVFGTGSQCPAAYSESFEALVAAARLEAGGMQTHSSTLPGVPTTAPAQPAAPQSPDASAGQKAAPPSPVIPPPPAAQPAHEAPEFVSVSVVHMSREDRWARAVLFAGNEGPRGRYLALNPTELPADERIAAQRQMIREHREAMRSPVYQSMGRVGRAVDAYQRALWAEGSTELARWVFERRVELQGTTSDGPPDPEKVSLVACALGEAARQCQPSEIRECEAATALLKLTESLCLTP